MLQNKWMAMNKQGKMFPCFVHCMIYSLAVTVCTAWFVSNNFHDVVFWAVVVFWTHFPVDYFSLADKWLEFIEGRSLKGFMENGTSDIPVDKKFGNYYVLRGGFTAIVYTVVDNTMHLVSMLAAAHLLAYGNNVIN